MKKVIDFIDLSDYNRVKFPTLSKCLVCGGFNAIYSRKEGKTICDSQLAWEIAMIEHGYYISKWEGSNVMNRFDIPTKCSCKCSHSFERRKIGKCLHRVRCTKCGFSSDVDSSD